MANPVGRPPGKNSLGSKSKYDAQYVKDNYHRVPLNLGNSFYEEIKNYTMKKNIPVNTFIKSAIREKLDRELSTESLYALPQYLKEDEKDQKK